jgi:hypothetical protein
MYLKSRTDLDIAQLPSPLPVMGPAGSSIVDPDFGNPIMRATDETTILLSGKPSGFITPGLGGSADVNVWNTDSTMLYLQDSGGGGAIFSFDPQTMAVGRLFPSWRPGGPILFSRIDPNICFELRGTQFVRHDLSDRALAVPPEPVPVCDFASGLPAATKWDCMGGVEVNDTVFTAGFSTTGGQNTGVWACSYTVGKGYRFYDTKAGTITGDYGPTGTAIIADRFTVHNCKASKDGAWLVIATGENTQDHGPFFWKIDTTEVRWVGKIAWGGHWTAGYGEFFNMDSNGNLGIPYYAHCRRRLDYPEGVTRLANPSPSPPNAMVGCGDHLSINGPNNSMIVATTANTGNKEQGPFPAPWYNEVLGYDLDGSGRVYRFCHNFTNPKNGNFYSSNAIGVVDQLNRFVAFCSNWMDTLANKRGDTFIVRLR